MYGPNDHTRFSLEYTRFQSVPVDSDDPLLAQTNRTSLMCLSVVI